MRPKIRVLYFIPSLEQGGAERQLAELIQGLDLERYEPRLVLCNTADHLGYDLPVGKPYSVDAPSGPTPRTLLRLADVLKDARPHIVHSHMGHQNIYGRLAVRMTGIGRSVSSVLCTRLPAKYIRHERLTNRFSHGLIVNSIGIRAELAERAHLAPESMDVVENGVDTVRFRPLADDARGVERAKWQMTPRTLVVPGRISPQKNQMAIVGALALMRRRGTLPADLRVIFAGRQEASTRYGTWLRALIAVTGMREHVRFVGIVREIEALVAAADGMLLPSNFEGLPNAVLEAMACGTPAIVSPPANTDHLVEDGREGVDCGGTTPSRIADGLERFLAKTPAEWRAMGVRGRAHAESRFSIARMVGRTCAVYERVLADYP